MNKLFYNYFLALILSTVLIPITGNAYNQTYNVKVGETFTVYTTYHSDITAVLWTIPYDYVVPASYIGPAATSAKFRAIKEIPSGVIIQAVTYTNYHRSEVDDWLVCITGDGSGGGGGGSSTGLKDGDTFQYSSNGVNLKFKVISAKDKTCMVGAGGASNENVAIPKSTSKESVVVPEYANGFKVVEVAFCAFYECKYVKTVFLPNSIKEIGYNAFKGCSGLQFITVPNSVTFIDAEAFAGCTSLKEIVFGSSLTEIGSGIISGDTKLEMMTSLAIVPPNVSFWTFSSSQSFENNVKIYVPKESLFTYRNADYWNWFSVQPIGGEGDSKPYAVLTDSNTKLTFYYDDKKETRGGMDVGPFSNWEKVDWYGQRENITTVLFDESFADCDYITSTRYWFYGCKKLTEIDGIKNLPTANVTDMTSMFNGCTSLNSIDVSNFNTSNVTSMLDMFDACSSLTNLDLRSFNTSNVLNMSGMFLNCESLTSLDLSSFNTSNVVDMEGMFINCKTLTCLDLSNFNTANVTDMASMFRSCSSLKSLNISNFNTSKVKRFNSMFGGCQSLISLDLSNFNTANVTSMSYMFQSCSSLKNIDVSIFITMNVEYMYNMFQFCKSLTKLDLSSFNTANVKDMGLMFDGCSSLTTIYASEKWNTEKVANGDNMFNGCTNLVGGAGTVLDASHTDYTYARIDGGENAPGYFTDKGRVLDEKSDVNYDGVVDVADIASIISEMAGNGTYAAAADVNGDGKVDVADIATVITRMAELARIQRNINEEE